MTMARLLYLDCFAGAAGDMLLGALIDLGFDPTHLNDMLAALKLPDASVSVERVMRGAISAPLLKVHADHDQPHRHWTDIDAMLAAADLPAPVVADARRIFRRLAEAEATIHGHKPETVHFHEVGAIDAIVDITGFCLGLHELRIDTIVSAPLPLGSGQTRCEHGIIPLPAPATVALLKDAPVTAYPKPVETVTPTGAAIISTLAASYGPLPPLTLQGVGYGAGTRVDPDGPPNVVRALLGLDEALPENAETTYVIEANIDDMNPEFYEPLAAALEKAGALDVTLIPCIMKRGRPGVLLQITCAQSAVDALIEQTFTHSSTLGLRFYPTRRAVCERTFETVETAFGPVVLKLAHYQGKQVGAKPEYKDLAASGLPMPEALRQLQEALAKK
jgi:pyridinium-3,5-bisthiocarboxylic acid mononucleotide nickel chelatase